MRYLKMLRALSLLVRWCSVRVSLPLRNVSPQAWRKYALCAGGLLLIRTTSFAATPPKFTINVYTSTATANPSALASQFLLDISSGYVANISTGIFANSYTATIISKKPLNVPPPPLNVQPLIDLAVSNAQQPYAFVYGDGVDAGRATDLGVLDTYIANCSTSTLFYLIGTTATWDQGTCIAALYTVHQQIYGLDFDTTTVIPGF